MQIMTEGKKEKEREKRKAEQNMRKGKFLDWIKTAKRKRGPSDGASLPPNQNLNTN